MKQTSLILLIAVVLSSCAKKSDQQLFKEGMAAEEQKDFTSALKDYQEIVDRLPQTALAESSQLRIAVVYNNDVRDIPKSIDAYRKFCAMFPKSPQAPTALFLTGFLFNNELHNIDSARMVYETFIQNYPDHELTSSARFELETLGKDPTQIFQPDVATNTGVKDSNATKAPGGRQKAKKPTQPPKQEVVTGKSKQPKVQ